MTCFFNENSVFQQLNLEKLDFKNKELNLTKYFSFNNVDVEIERWKTLFKNNTNQLISPIDYLCFKYLISMTIRFEGEKFILNLEKDNFKDKYKDILKDWNDNNIKKIWGGIQPHILNDKLEESIFQKFKRVIEIIHKMNFLNHLENLKWAPLMEFPVHKLLMHYDQIKKLVLE